MKSYTREFAQILFNELYNAWTDGRHIHKMSFWLWAETHRSAVDSYCGGANWDRAMNACPKIKRAFNALLDAGRDDVIAAFEPIVHRLYKGMVDDAYAASLDTDIEVSEQHLPEEI